MVEQSKIQKDREAAIELVNGADEITIESITVRGRTVSVIRTEREEKRNGTNMRSRVRAPQY